MNKVISLTVLKTATDLKLDESAPTRTVFIKTCEGAQIFPIEIPSELQAYLPPWSLLEIKVQGQKLDEPAE